MKFEEVLPALRAGEKVRESFWRPGSETEKTIYADGVKQ